MSARIERIESGKYQASYEHDGKTESKFFESLNEANDWMNDKEGVHVTIDPEPAASEMSPEEAAILGQPNPAPTYPNTTNEVQFDPEAADDRSGDLGGQEVNAKQQAKETKK